MNILFSKFLLEGLLVLAVSIGFGFLRNKLGMTAQKLLKRHC